MYYSSAAKWCDRPGQECHVVGIMMTQLWVHGAGGAISVVRMIVINIHADAPATDDECAC